MLSLVELDPKEILEDQLKFQNVGEIENKSELAERKREIKSEMASEKRKERKENERKEAERKIQIWPKKVSSNVPCTHMHHLC